MGRTQQRQYADPQRLDRLRAGAALGSGRLWHCRNAHDLYRHCRQPARQRFCLGLGQLKADYGQRLQRRLLVQSAFQSRHLRPTLLLRAADCRLLPSARPRLTFARHLPEFCDFKFRTFA